MFDIQRIKERAKFIRPMLIPLILHIGMLTFTINWIENNPDGQYNFWIAISPMLPAIFVGLGMVKALHKLDELERKTLLEGMVFSFMFTLLFVNTLGLLENNGFSGINGTYIGLVMVVLWLVGKIWSMNKYHEK